MKILPPRIEPLTQNIIRKHRPRQVSRRDGYREYRQCLRRDFGFACAFCQLREEDWVLAGADRSGFMTFEHWHAQSAHPEQANVYENCIYICRRCNRARSNKPLKSKAGHRLLEPTSAIWAEHFLAEGDRLVGRPGDMDAEYTQRTYDLNDPIKVELRSERRRRIGRALRLIREGPGMLQQAHAELNSRESRQRNSNPAKTTALAQALEELRRQILDAWEELKRYQAIPEGSQETGCRCAQPPQLELPEALALQVQEVEAPATMHPQE